MLNYRYVLDVMQVLESEEVLLKIVDDTAAVILRPVGDQSYMYLVMPIKI